MHATYENTITYETFCYVNNTSVIFATKHKNEPNYVSRRTIEIQTSGITFGEAYYADSSIDNHYCIPMYIYGID